MGEKAHGAAVRLHDVRGERSNVPREAALYEAGIYPSTPEQVKNGIAPNLP